MVDRKYYFVINPQSANGATGRNWGSMARAVSRELGDFDYAFTRAPMEAAAVTRTALERGFDTIVAVGGDGTLHEVVNGFFAPNDGGPAKPVAPGAALGLIPRGTGGDFRRSLGLDLELGSALALIKSGHTKPLDVGRATYRNAAGRDEQRYFVNETSFGISAEAAREVNARSKALGPKLTFALGSFRALLNYRDRRVRISLDGAPARALTITSVTAANGRFFGGGMKVAPAAALGDGLFSITIWSGMGLGAFLKHNSKLYSGAHVSLPGTRCETAKKLVAESDERVLLELDGEQPGTLPCTIEMVPSAIRLLC